MNRLIAYISFAPHEPSPSAPFGVDKRGMELGPVGWAKEALSKLADPRGVQTMVQWLEGRGFVPWHNGREMKRVLADPSIGLANATYRQLFEDGVIDDKWTRRHHLSGWRDQSGDALDYIRETTGLPPIPYRACPAYETLDSIAATQRELSAHGVTEIVYDRTARVSDSSMWREIHNVAGSLRMRIIPEGCLTTYDWRIESSQFLDGRTSNLQCMVMRNDKGNGSAERIGKHDKVTGLTNVGWERISIIGYNQRAVDPAVVKADLATADVAHAGGKPKAGRECRASVGIGEYDAVAKVVGQ